MQSPAESWQRMPELNCVIADDEPLALELLQSLLGGYTNVKVLAACRDGSEALSAIREKAPDVVFLDVEMPGLDGFDVVKRIQPELMPAIVFTTAFNQYAIDAFDIHAVDYVLKPLNAERLDLAIKRATQRVETQRFRQAGNKADVLNAIGRISADQNMVGYELANASGTAAIDSTPCQLVVRDSGKAHFISPEEIEWVDAAGDYMCIHVGPETLVTRMTMKTLLEQLKPELFVRIHRSTLVNITKVNRLEELGKGDCILHLECSVQLKCSRRYRTQLMELLTLI